MRPFHLAFAVRDLDATRAFYGDVLGCEMGRSAPTWQDFDFFGHQLSAHVAAAGDGGSGQVDGKAVPIPHFGVVLGMDEWAALAARLREGGQGFLIEPEIRFAGAPGEQGTFFLQDPAGNTLEFKGFREMAGVFATRGRRVIVTDDDRLKRLGMRSWRRGTREMDLILGPFSDVALAGLDVAALDAFEALLSENDHDLYAWIVGAGESPAAFRAIVGQVRAHHRIG